MKDKEQNIQKLSKSKKTNNQTSKIRRNIGKINILRGSYEDSRFVLVTQIIQQLTNHCLTEGSDVKIDLKGRLGWHCSPHETL